MAEILYFPQPEPVSRQEASVEACNHPGLVEIFRLLSDPSFQKDYVDAQTLPLSHRVANGAASSEELEAARATRLAQYETLQQEFSGIIHDEARQAELVTALDVWGTADARGLLPGQRRANSGVIHLLGYKGVKEEGKYKRFSQVQTLQDVIDYSNRLAVLLDDPSQAEQVATMTDEQGNERMYLLHEGQMVVCSTVDGTPKVITVLPNYDETRFMSKVGREQVRPRYGMKGKRVVQLFPKEGNVVQFPQRWGVAA